MPKATWFAGLLVGALLVGYSAIAQDPTTRRPPRELEARVQSLEEAFIEQQSRLRSAILAINDLVAERGPVGIQPGPETKGKFDSPVKIVEISREYDLIKLENGFAIEVAKESIAEMSSSYKNSTVELYTLGSGPYPYKVLISRPMMPPVTIKGRLMGRP